MIKEIIGENINLRQGFSAIPYGILNSKIKPIDFVIFSFINSHKKFFIPSHRYIRKILKIHLHTLKRSLKRIQDNNYSLLDNNSNFFFIPNCLFDLNLRRLEFCILAYQYSKNGSEYICEHEIQRIFGSSLINIKKSILSLKEKGLEKPWEVFSIPRFTKITEHSSLLNWEDYKEIAEYYEELRYNIGLEYNQNWEKRPVFLWNIQELQTFLSESFIMLNKNYSLEEMKGILQLKAQVILKYPIVAKKMLSDFNMFYLFSNKNLLENITNYYKVKNSGSITSDEWYIRLKYLDMEINND